MFNSTNCTIYDMHALWCVHMLFNIGGPVN